MKENGEEKKQKIHNYNNKNEFEKSKCKTRNIGFINFENNI